MKKQLTTDILQNVIQPRKSDTYKGNYGKIVCIGGNEEYGGAIILSAKAAIYSGAGLVTVVSHPTNQSALHAQVPEAMFLEWSDKENIKKVLTDADVVIIGPGLGTSENSRDLLDFTFSQINKKQHCVVNGSAITLISKNPSLFSIKRLRELNLIFTPHQEEWHRLSGLSIPSQSTENNSTIQKHLNQIVVLKKTYTEIYLNPKDIFVNTPGTPAMATGGMGDTLTGIIGSFLGQFKQNPQQSILAAVFLHSYLAEQLAKQNYVVLPTTLIESLPTEIQKWSSL